MHLPLLSGGLLLEHGFLLQGKELEVWVLGVL